MKHALLNRINDVTNGKFSCFDDEIEAFRFYSLETTWNNNIKGKSAIPPGDYILKPHVSPKYGDCYIIIDKETDGKLVGMKGAKREWCLVHPANYYYQLKGCISLGLNSIDINGDEILDVTNSRKACNKFYNWANGENIHLKIVNNGNI